MVKGFMNMEDLDCDDLIWNDDQAGEDIGYSLFNTIGIYTSEQLNATFYVDYETGTIIFAETSHIE